MPHINEKEYIIKYRVETEWHHPHNTTTYNEYVEIMEAKSAKDAVEKTLPVFSNPNKTVKLLSVKQI